MTYKLAFLCINRPCAPEDSIRPPHLYACLVSLPAVRGYSDRSGGLMGLAFRAAASQNIKSLLSFVQPTAGVRGL